MDHAHRVVERIVMDGEPRMAGIGEELQQVAERDILLHGDDVRARHHYVADTPLPERQDIAQHRALGRREFAFGGLAFLQHLGEIGAQRAGTAQPQERPQALDQPLDA